MEPEDADSVAQIEKDSFTQPWSRQGFLDAMRLPENIMLVAQEDGEILGYQCTYVSFDSEMPKGHGRQARTIKIRIFQQA